MTQKLELITAIAVLYASHSLGARFSRVGGFRNPLSLFNLAWLVAFLVYYSGWIGYDPIKFKAYAILLSSIVVGNLGVAAVMLLWGSDVSHSRVQKRDVIWVDSTRWMILLGLYVVGLTAWLAAVADTFGAGALLNNPAVVREGAGTDAFLNNLGLIPRYCFLLGPIVVASLAVNRRPWARVLTRPVLLVSAGVLLVTLLASLGRTLPLVAVATVAGVGILKQAVPRSQISRRMKRRRVLGAAGALLIGILVFQGLAVGLGKTGSVDPRVNVHLRAPLKDSPMAAAFVYISGGIPAFGELADGEESSIQVRQDGTPYTSGLRTFRFVAEFAPGVDVPPLISPYVNTPLPFNVYTSLEPYYRDFGAVGALIASFAIGALTAAMQVRSVGNARLRLPAALLIGLGAWGPFTNLMMQPFVIASLVIAYLITRKVRERQPSPIGGAAADQLLLARRRNDLDGRRVQRSSHGSFS